MSKRNGYLAACSILGAAGLLALKILIAPPISEAATVVTLNPDQMTLTAGKGLPSFDDTYQRHTGVLDTLDRR